MNDPSRAESNVAVSAAAESPSLPVVAHLLCGWPLVLVGVGGAVGGGLGGAAYGINLKVYGSKLSPPVKVILNLLVGLAAIGIWAGIAYGIRASTAPSAASQPGDEAAERELSRRRAARAAMDRVRQQAERKGREARARARMETLRAERDAEREASTGRRNKLESLTRHVEARLRLKRPDMALDLANRAVQLDVRDPRGFLLRARVHHAMGNHDGALADLHRAVALAPDHAPAQVLRGQVQRARGEPRSALASFKHAVALDPDRWDGWAGQAEVLAELERPAEALDCVKRALAGCPAASRDALLALQRRLQGPQD